MVTIPVKVYTATKATKVAFNLITPKGNRVKQVYTDSVTGETVTHAECGKGYEYEKDKMMPFSEAELKAIESEPSKSVDIQEFVDANSLSPLSAEQCYYIGPDKGADKAFKLLAETMKSKEKVAIGQWFTRGREHLVAIIPYKNGMLLSQLFYADEIRDNEEMEPAKVQVSPQEKEIADILVDTLSTGAFDPSKYRDGYLDRVNDLIQKKIDDPSGVFTTVVAKPAEAKVFDLVELLKQSVLNKAKKAPKSEKTL